MAAEYPETKVHGDYTVGWICALSKEQTAATAMLDKRHGDLSKPHSDSNTYTLGSIGKHNVVIACLPEGKYGTNAAANVVSLLAGTFPSVRSCLMVGIGGGIPSNKVRLGDVVVGSPTGQFPGVVQWDMGKAKQGGEFERTGALNNPPNALLTALGRLKSGNELNGSKVPLYLDDFKARYPKAAKEYLRSDSLVDICFRANYDHVSPVKPDRNANGEEGDDEEEEEMEEENDFCRFCDKTKVVKRKPRDMRVHYGLIASRNQVIKDARSRDKLKESLDGKVLCVEMEAAGIVSNFPCLVIRGICDYSDSHKNEAWQKHAALVAAAYAKELLLIVQPTEVQGDRLIKDALEEVELTLNEIALGQKQQNFIQKQHAISKWLSPLSPSARHRENQRKRVGGTGTWLLEDPNFLNWSSEIAKCQILSCYGDPGAGKTIISSLVIDELMKHIVAGSRIGLGYVYCDYADQQAQTTENILGALLTQLLEILPEIPKSVFNLYEKCAYQKKSLRSEDAERLLHDTCEQFSKVYICLDALDELADLRGLLKCLHDGPSSMHIFLTGRPYVEETVQEYLAEGQRIIIKPHRRDIQQFIEHEIGGPNDIEPKAMDEKLKTEILEKVVDSAKGTFLLPTLQVRAVLQATTLRDREEALKKLPSNLSEAYTAASSALSERAGTIIAWIHFAGRPLAVNELLCSLGIRDGDTCYDPRGTPIRETLLNCCHGLAVIDRDTSTVRLVHYSLEEHLYQQNQIFGLSKAQWNGKIASTCLRFLSFEPVSNGEGPSQNHTTVTLLRYAATEWGHHLRRSEELPDEAFNLGREYLDEGWKKSADSLRLLYERMYRFQWKPRQKDILPTHIAAFFGLPGIVLHLISTVCCADSKDTLGRTPLSWAAENGHQTVVKTLLEAGAAVDSKDTVYGQTPLSWAAHNGHQAVVKTLLKAGAAVDSKDTINDLTPFSWAARGGHEAVVQTLLEAGAAVNSKDTASARMSCTQRTSGSGQDSH
ncbi:hypothetical protein NYO67_8959 [Aspergillus flavus]|nr:hypothetical protein NYO67_8959 [Aspergillus flavus]